MTIAPRWLTIFLDLPAADHQHGCDFWRAATGYQLSSPRGEHEEFATLVPPSGQAHLRIQRTRGQRFGAHLDLHVPDVEEAVVDAVAVGADLVSKPGHAIMRSPAGFAFCLVPTGAERTPSAPAHWGGHRSRPDQLSIDLSHDAWDGERAFWTDLTGWPVTSSSRPEFARLHTPAWLPVRILLQRLDSGRTCGHLDIAADDRAAEVERLSRLGATQVSCGPAWTVLSGPDRSIFCVTDRDPHTGLPV